MADLFRFARFVVGTSLLISAVSSLDNGLGPPPLELYLIPHTHADVGWLQTVNSLSRMNVSRILDGVVGNLYNDTMKRRRFVWDEMAFLQLWWANQATATQKAQFIELVKDGRIEFAVRCCCVCVCVCAALATVQTTTTN